MYVWHTNAFSTRRMLTNTHSPLRGTQTSVRMEFWPSTNKVEHTPPQ